MTGDRLDLRVKGMTCAACVRRLETALQRVPGVNGASVNLATDSATVFLDASAGSPGAVLEAVGRLGFEGSVLSGGAEEAASASPGDRIGPARIRAIVAVLLAAPVFVLGMATMHHTPSWVAAAMVALATPVQFLCGWPFYRAAWLAIRHGAADMNVLVVLGTTAAYGFSLYAWLTGGEHLYFESASTIVALVLVGRYLEANARGRATAAIRSLMALSPRTARVRRAEGAVEIGVGEVMPGDEIEVRPGERIAADGVVIEGESRIDESMLTGESWPVARVLGDPVVGGTLNTTGSIVVRAERVGADTVLSQIARLVAQAQGSKAPIQDLADRVAARFVPFVLAFAAVTLAYWLTVARVGVETALWPTVAVLVIACPCALGLATPIAVIAGAGRGAELGVLVRDGAALERLGRVNTMLLDKTGTLTGGRPRVVDTAPEDGITEDELLAVAASVECFSEHPIGKAIVEEGLSRGLQLRRVTAFETEPGSGVRGVADGRVISVGRSDWAVREEPPSAEVPESDGERHQAACVVAVDGRRLGAITVHDAPSPSSAQAVREMRTLGLDVVMVTGDSAAAARGVASEVGIDQCEADVRPAVKADVVHRYQISGRCVAMVGDGINDAPALAAADVGIAIGTGADVALETASVALLGADLRGVPRAVRLGRATLRTIRQNLFWAIAYNAVGIPLAAAGLLNPMLAGGAMGLSSVCVVMNSLRLRRLRA